MKTTCYLQVEPTFWRHSPERLSGIKVQRVTAKKPQSPIPGSVVVRLDIDIEDAAFLPLRPTVEVTIPAAHTEVAIQSAPVED